MTLVSDWHIKLAYWNYTAQQKRKKRCTDWAKQIAENYLASLVV
jgi:hypothetical protein